MADPWTHYWYYGQQQHSPYGQHPQGAQLYFTPSAGTMPLPMVQQGPPPPMWAQPQGQMMVAPQMNPMTPAGTHAHKLMNGYQSPKYPELHPTLAPDTSAIRYDLRKPPKEGIQHAWYHQSKSAFAFARPYQSIRLVSADFPWSIDIKTGQAPITVEYIWEALYQCLQQEMADSEWGILALPGGDRKRRDMIAKAREKRLDANKNDKVKKPKKIDWLGESTYLKGLDIDDDFAAKREVPGEDEVEEVWVVRMGGP